MQIARRENKSLCETVECKTRLCCCVSGNAPLASLSLISFNFRRICQVNRSTRCIGQRSSVHDVSLHEIGVKPHLMRFSFFFVFYRGFSRYGFIFQTSTRLKALVNAGKTNYFRLIPIHPKYFYKLSIYFFIFVPFVNYFFVHNTALD